VNLIGRRIMGRDKEGGEIVRLESKSRH
jgi:hypothetical protein